MNIDHRNPRLRRGFAFVALAALLGLSVVSLSQCRMVNDSVTGVDIRANSGTSARSDCVRACNEARKNCMKSEDARHKAAQRACGADHACKKVEQRLHQDNLKACVSQSQLCKRGCYNEGAGSAGR
jgi:hypothetical protein